VGIFRVILEKLVFKNFEQDITFSQPKWILKMLAISIARLLIPLFFLLTETFIGQDVQQKAF
jgi:hypothetical protein